MSVVEDLNRRMEFIVECDRLKQILRRNLLADGSRQENDAEHSWHLALCAMTLWEYAPPGADLEKVLRMLLIHDIVEIDAGDTFAYDAVGNLDKEAREQAAADRIFGLLPPQQGARYRALWEEFDAMETPEARFAAAMDRLQPLLNNFRTDGHTWKLGNVRSPQVYQRLAPVREIGGPLWDYVEGLIRESVKRGYLQD